MLRWSLERMSTRFVAAQRPGRAVVTPVLRGKWGFAASGVEALFAGQRKQCFCDQTGRVFDVLEGNGFDGTVHVTIRNADQGRCDTGAAHLQGIGIAAGAARIGLHLRFDLRFARGSFDKGQRDRPQERFRIDSNPYLQEYSFVKTTIDLPEDVLQRAKITAIQRKTTLKELICQSLIREMESPQAGSSNAESQRKQRASALLNSLDSIQLATPIGRFDREQAQRHPSPARD